TVTSDAIYVHRVNASTGTVALVDIDDDNLNGDTGYSFGGTLEDLVIDETGRFVFATGFETVSFGIADDGLLTEIDRVSVVGDTLAVLSVLP
ncbi:MAG: hypothetical protein AAF658_14460, partial [Myxococcota bacterium]